jgi:hypothetical protein
MNEQEILDKAKRVAMSVDGPDQPYESVLRRRDRKHRNQRIRAGVVGIAVFLAAVWIVTSLAFLDRGETIVPAASGATGPATTGPAVTGSTIDPSGEFVGLPPEGADPSSPEVGTPVGGFHKIHYGWVYIYADGRVISWADRTGLSPEPYGFHEQRLTSEGVELVRSGALQPADLFLRPDEVPASAWEDPTMRPYVPYRYAICADDLPFFPAAAKDLLRGKERTFDVGIPSAPDNDVFAGNPGRYVTWKCFDLTTEKARALDAILSNAGFINGLEVGFQSYDRVGPEQGNASPTASFYPILPDGTFAVHQLG